MFNRNKFLLILKSLLALIIISITSNFYIDYLIRKNGQNYKRLPDYDECINNIEIPKNANILIGTSITRELINHDLQEFFKINNKNYFNCGVPSPVVNFQIHLFILHLLSQRHDLNGKEFLLGTDIHSGIDRRNIFDNNFFSGYFNIPMYLAFSRYYFSEHFAQEYLLYDEETEYKKISNSKFIEKLRYIKAFLRSNKNFLDSLLKPLILPSNRLLSVGSKLKKQNIRNLHLNQKFNSSDVQTSIEIKTLNSNESISIIEKRVGFLISELNKLSEEKGFTYKFLINPINRSCINRSLFKNKQNIKNILIKNGIAKSRIFDISLNNYEQFPDEKYFADCFHLNSLGKRYIRSLRK